MGKRTLTRFNHCHQPAAQHDQRANDPPPREAGTPAGRHPGQRPHPIEPGSDLLTRRVEQQPP
ncbi:MAG: hypothetical protein K6356_09560 [Chloroflexus sp.]